MADLVDSGIRRNWETGAMREGDCGKGRCDLLPLKVITDITDDVIFTEIEQYIRTGNLNFLRKAITLFAEIAFGNINTALLEVAKQYEDGARKYADRNWEKGIPSHVFIDSGVRHYIKWRRGDTDEPHDRAFVWNMLGTIWTHENKPELIDLPFAKNTPDPEQSQYASLTDADLQIKICQHMSMIRKNCEDCPLFELSGGWTTKDNPCYEFPTFREVAIKWLEEHT